MHGHHYGHADIAKRQGLVGGLVSGLLGNNPSQTPANAENDPLGLGSIVGGVTSALLPTQSASVPSTSSSSFVSSTTSMLSSTSSAPPTSSTPIPSLVVTSSSNGTPVIVTATVVASPSTSVGTVPTSFLKNKPLETGVFTVIGIISAIILILIVTVWIRSSNRRSRLNREALDASSWNPTAQYGFRDEDRGSMEKLVRWNSTSSATHNPAGDGAGQGGYLTAPLPLRIPAQPADGYGQPASYNGQPPQGPGYSSEYEYAAHIPPRSPNPVHDPGRNPKVAATPSNGSNLDQVNPILPPSQNLALQRHGSLSNSPPASPAASGENKGNLSRSLSSHSRALNPGLQEMPVAPPLPAKFGTDGDDGERPYSGIGGDFSHDIHRALKVANL